MRPSVQPPRPQNKSIAIGSQSNTVFNFFDCSFYNFGGTNSDIFYIDGATNFHMSGGFWYNVGATKGRAFMYVNTANSSSDLFTITGVSGEPNGIGVDYGVFFGNEAVRSPASWFITMCRFDCKTNIIYASDNTTLYNLKYSEITDVGAVEPLQYGVSVKNLRNSTIDMHAGGKFNSRVGGLIEGCSIKGSLGSFVLLGSLSVCIVNDMEYGSQWNTTDSFGNGPAFPVALTGGGATTSTWASKVVTANSIIVLFPTSASAAAAVGSAAGVYISGKNPGVSFTITHPATEGALFNALIFN